MEKPQRQVFLVLEDDANDAIMIRRALTHAHCEAIVCRNTSEAKAYVQGAGMYSDRWRFPLPDAFITDLRLGEDSGMDFIQWLRGNELLGNVPIIILSGAATAEDIQEARLLGVSKILAKPSDPIELQDLLIHLSRELCPLEAEIPDKREQVVFAD